MATTTARDRSRLGKPTEVGLIGRVRDAASAWALFISPSARRQMGSRNARAADVRLAIVNATEARSYRDGTWLLSGGVDANGDALNVVVDPRWEPIRIVTIK